MKKVSDKTVVPKHKKGVVGGDTIRVFVYRAVGDGSTRLKLVESRSFQHHSQISKFKLSVQVR